MTARPGGRPGHPPRLAGWVAVAALAHAGALGALAAMMVPRLAPPGEAPGVEVVLGGGEAGGGGESATQDHGLPAPEEVAEVPPAEAAPEMRDAAAEVAAEPQQPTVSAVSPPAAETEVAAPAPTLEQPVVQQPVVEQPVVMSAATVAQAVTVPAPGSADVKEAPPPAAISWPAPAPVPQRAAPVRRAASVRVETPAGSGHGVAPGAPSDDAPARPGAGDGGGGEADPREVAAWQAALSAWIARNQTYPQAARHLHTEGVVQVRFVLDAGGRVTSVAVTRASGSEALDTAALTLLRDAQLPPPPARMSAERRTVTVPIRYRLQ